MGDPGSEAPGAIRVRFWPPMAGGQQKTGWEALDKWVSTSNGGQAGAAAPSGKTGWEALDKWVGTSDAGQAGGAAAPASSRPAPGGGGLLGFLKRLFGG